MLKNWCLVKIHDSLIGESESINNNFINEAEDVDTEILDDIDLNEIDLGKEEK